MSRAHLGLIATALFSLLARPLPAGVADEPILPPLAPWEGASRALVVDADHPWVTPAERSGLTATPRYAETVAWLERLAAAAQELSLVSLGRSFEGRQIWMVVASAEGATTPEALHAGGRPVLLAHAGIHSGEIDGKDAGLMLLRDLTVGGRLRDLLERANLLFVPILNVDGHERFTPFGRINQRGPVEMGWRTNGRNQNLNRDFAKLDTPGVRALVGAFNAWRPDLVVDLHVTDGADYQYDVTWGFNGPHGHSPSASRWLAERVTPAARKALREAVHVPGPFVFPLDGRRLELGLLEWTSTPRFSDGYGDARHLPSILVENHSLKPYDRRVLGTYVFLESVLRTLADGGEELAAASLEDRERRRAEIPLAWGRDEGEPERLEHLGIERSLRPSAISGGVRVEWTGRPVTERHPRITTRRVTASAKRPAAYWVPPSWPEVIERLRLHGVEMEVIETPREVEVELYRLEEAELAGQPFEGRVRVSARPVVEQGVERFPAGSVRVPTDQALGDLAVLLLEPAAPDSFFQWGFFLGALQRTEYVEGYVMEPMAERMLAEDPELAAEFEQKLLADPEFAGDPRERLQWFYRRTPFFDPRWNLYPVAREPAVD